MNAIRMIAGEVFGLFIDDGSLAIAILILVGIVAVIALGGAAPAWVSGGLLFIGCVLVLVENVARRARRG